ncbi:MAG: nuclear transport factor 2 family protein [Myxococcota bacterium]
MSPSPEAAEVQRTVDWVAIRRLHSRYADVINRRAWPELADLFLPDAVVRVEMPRQDPIDSTGPEALGGFIESAVARFDLFQFVVLEARIEWPPELPDGEAMGRIYMVELRLDKKTGQETKAFGLYQDRYRKTADGWRFAARRFQPTAWSGRDLSTLPLPALDF